MKKLIPLILFCLILFSKSFGQTEISEIRFHFLPAFIASSEFDFKMKNPSLKYEIFTPYYKEEHSRAFLERLKGWF